jgi:hypothetical protein
MAIRENSRVEVAGRTHVDATVAGIGRVPMDSTKEMLLQTQLLQRRCPAVDEVATEEPMMSWGAAEAGHHAATVHSVDAHLPVGFAILIIEHV